MEALIASISGKDYVYAGVIVAILSAFTAYTVFERHEGAQDALRPVTVLAHKAEIKVAVGTAVAQSTEKEIAKNYDNAVSRPVSPIGIVCINPSSSELPQAGEVTAPGVGDIAADTGAEEHYDPSGAVLANDADAEAQIIYLQGRVAELETQMKGSP